MLGLIALIIISSCSKNDEILPPEIELISVTPTTVTEFVDSIDVILSYKDEDGDLGYSNPDSFAMEVQDKRLTVADKYFVSPLAPPTEILPIQGTINFKIKNTFLLGSGSSETTTFTIKIKDRAGNWSNEVVTPTITINR